MAIQHQFFRVETVDGITIVTPTILDFLDQQANFGIKAELLRYVDESKPAKVLFDFQHINRFSTELIGTLLSAKKSLAKFDGTILLCGMHETHREIFQLLNLDGTVFEILPTLEDGIKSLGGDAESAST